MAAANAPGPAPAGQAASLSIDAFDAAAPQAFYLLDSQADMETLSDAALIVEGVRLPMHSQVLSLQSKVLRGMFADLMGAGGSGSEARVGRERKADDQKSQPFELAEPLKGCSLFEAALFLRFLYHPRELGPSSLAEVQGSLPALLRASHKLDAGSVTDVVASYLAGKAAQASWAELIAWTEAAEVCQLDSLQLKCSAQLACKLATKPQAASPLAAAMADAAQLEGCDKSMLLLLLGMLTAAGRELAEGQEGFASQLAWAETLEAALSLAASPNSFEWRIERFSEQPSAVGMKLASTPFTAGGRQWHLQAYCGGETAKDQGHLSLYAVPKHAGGNAGITLTVVDQGPGERLDCVRTDDVSISNCLGWGWRKFMSAQQLRSRPGYLAGDKLVIRAQVAVRL